MKRMILAVIGAAALTGCVAVPYDTGPAYPGYYYPAPAPAVSLHYSYRPYGGHRHHHHRHYRH